MPENLSYLLGRKGLDKNLFEELGIAAQDTGTPIWRKWRNCVRNFLSENPPFMGRLHFTTFSDQKIKAKKSMSAMAALV